MLGLLAGTLARRASAQETTPQGEVQLSLVSFGVGGLAREGDWAGIQVQMLDTASSGRDIVLRIAVRDEDGDETQYDRVVTANPGALQSFWIYAWIPFRGMDLDYELKAYEAIDSGNSDVGQFGFRVGRLIGTLPIYNPQIQAPSVGLAGVIGTNQLGLDQYGYTLNGRLAMMFGHELLRTSPGLAIDNLPDRWQGISSFDTLVWSTSSTAAHTPGRLSPEKARAIRVWVEHGGHLVIVLPSSGDPWYLGSHPLRTILPEIATPERREGVDLEPFRSLLTESSETPLPTNAVVYGMSPLDDAQENTAIPILNGPAGECVAIRRLMGSGMVTLVGLPLGDGALRRAALPDPESFWHRILGMRGDILRPDQLTDQQKSDAGNRTLLLMDEGLAGAIAKTGRAVQGVLFGIIVFVIYWLVAGPLGFALLKARNKRQHAWMFFVASIASFTALAWIGATAMRPKSSNIQHLTMLEGVDGQETRRSRTWMSVMLPSYGDAVVSLEDPEQEGSFSVVESSDLLSPWSSPETLGSLTNGFPDNSGYRVESKNPSAIRVPTRATVKSFLAEWSGTISTDWSLPAPVGDPGALEEPKLTIDGTIVRGQIAHNLPGPLEDVHIVVVSGEIPILRAGQGLGRRQIARASVYALKQEWRPGETIDLEKQVTLISAGAQESDRRGEYFTTALRYGIDQSSITRSTGTLVDRLIAGMFVSQLEPPRFNAADNDPVGARLASRRLLHGWDLGKWFTQPTMIVIGVIDIPSDQASEGGLPTPVWVNGRKVPASGKTIVTWIYPFAPDPPAFMGAQSGAEGGPPSLGNSGDPQSPNSDAATQSPEPL